MTIEMSVKVIMILKQVMKDNSCLIVSHELKVNLYEMIIRLQYELFESYLQFFKVFEVFEAELHHSVGIVNLFVFVQDIKSF